MNTVFVDKNGNPFMPLGLQAHNSSTGTEMIKTAIEAVKKFHGNCLEAPVYWYQLEPEQGQYQMNSVKELIDEVRLAGLHLIVLWFGTSKNGHPNYVPEYIKRDPKTYHMAIGADKAAVPSLSPHCMATLERDDMAFSRLIQYIKEYDSSEKTVIAVQIENEMGLSGTDRDYSEWAEADYQQQIPEQLCNVKIEDTGIENIPANSLENMSPWKKRFGRYAHEVFSAWYHAQFIETLARTGKEIYDLPVLVNIMVQENGYEEAGLCYNAGAPGSRMLDVWKAGAPTVDLICPDIYNESKVEYERICVSYNRPDNALFIPESPIHDIANAMNAIVAAGKYGAIGLCCFGAESAVDEQGELLAESRDMALSMQTIRSLEPLLTQYRGTDKIHAITEEEFEKKRYIKLEHYHVIAHFLHQETMYLGYMTNTKSEMGKKKVAVRGRGILVQKTDNEFYLAGAGIALEFIKRPEPEDEMSFAHMSSRMASQLNFLTVEEGHFEGDAWICDHYRNGDETNFNQYVLDGQVIRIRLNQ